MVAIAVLVSAERAHATVTVVPDRGCPSREAIAADLARLGASELVAQLGSAAVRLDEPRLHIAFQDLRGEPLGDRVVTASADCDARALLAATVIAAFAGDWIQTKLAAPPPRITADARATSREPASRSTPTWAAEAGATFFALHDGSAAGLGLGARADLVLRDWLCSLLLEASSERERPLAGGAGGYRFLRVGLGVGQRMTSRRFFWDASLSPMLTLLFVRGKDLLTNEHHTDSGFGLLGQARFGWYAGRVRPHLFLGGSVSLPRHRLVLVDDPRASSLSIVEFQAGVGISVLLH